jgi:hypothetical protein
MATKSIYHPLNESLAEFRVLEIISDESASPVELQLAVMSMKESPRFTALSYIWGDAKVTEDILLDGQAFPVTANLAVALKRATTH